MGYDIRAFITELENFLNEKLLIANIQAQEVIRDYQDNLKQYKKDFEDIEND
jgi:hypothetical protein